jgi:hypothetical protein
MNDIISDVIYICNYFCITYTVGVFGLNIYDVRIVTSMSNDDWYKSYGHSGLYYCLQSAFHGKYLDIRRL